MGAETQTYDVQLRYLYREAGAKAGIQGLTRDLNQAATANDGLKRMVMGLGAVVATAFGARAAKHAFIDFNAEMEQMKISLTAITQANLDETFEAAHGQMEVLIKDFTQFAKLSPLTTKEVVDFAQNVEAGVFGANGSLEDFRIIAEQGSLAAKMLGADAGYAGVEIQEMLQGSVRKNMRFARNLMGFAGERDTEAFNAKPDLERLKIVEKALTSPAMKKAGLEFSNSFNGVTSTMKDNIQLALGQIGLPLFKAITAEVQSWNKWMEKNPELISSWSKDFSKALLDGFGVVKSIMKFVVDNRDLLLTIAKAVLMVKGVNMLAGGLAGLAGASGGGISGFTKNLTGAGVAAEGFSGALSKGIGILQGLGVVYAGATLVAGMVDDAQNRDMASSFKTAGLGEQSSRFLAGFSPLNGGAGGAGAESLLDRARREGFMGKNGQINTGKIADAFGASYKVGGTLAGQYADSLHSDYQLGTAEQQAGIFELALIKALDYQEQKRRNGGASTISPEELQGMSESLGWAFAGAVPIWTDALDKHDGNLFNGIIGFGAEMLNRKIALDATAADDEARRKKAEEKAKTGKGNTNITIKKIEVQTNDPDQFVFDLSEYARRARKYPGSASGQMGEG